MKKKIVAIALFLIIATFLVAFGGCEEETREHVTVLIYQKNRSNNYLCEITEEENEKEITLPYREGGYYFGAAVKFDDGRIYHYPSTGRIILDGISYTTPEGEKGESDEHAYERGTYRLVIVMDSMSEDYFPFLCYVTVHVV